MENSKKIFFNPIIFRAINFEVTKSYLFPPPKTSQWTYHSQNKLKTIPGPDAVDTTPDKTSILGLRSLGTCHWLRMSTNISPSEGIMKSPSPFRVGKEFMFGRSIFFALTLSSRRQVYFTVCRLVERKNFSCMKILENENFANSGFLLGT